jgi:hypothetical protein
MNIKYKNAKGTFITLEQIQALEEYRKVYFLNKVLVREEVFYQGEVNEEYIHNHNSESHEAIIANHPEAVIVDHLGYSNGYRLEKAYGYDSSGILRNRTHVLYDSNDKVVADEVIFDDEGAAIHSRRKVYWDLNISPNKEVFIASYRPDVNTIEGLYFNQEHENNTGQDAFTLGLDEIDQVIEITGMSLELAQYYFTPEIIPSW